MIQLTKEFKQQVIAKLLELRQNFDGTDSQFAKQKDINNAVFSRLKSGETDGLLRDAQWLNLGRELDVTTSERKWVPARTDVFAMIEEDVTFCQLHAKSVILADDCGIGKSFTGKYLARTLKNCFYVDASQAKTKQAFVRLIAKTIGVDDTDKYLKVKANIKFALKMLPHPVIIIDEAGDLEYTAFLEIKEFWNATTNHCGWYMMGADGLRNKMERGMTNKKVGFAELFSRFSERYGKIVPSEKMERQAFYRKLITDVLSVNMPDKTRLPEIVKNASPLITMVASVACAAPKVYSFFIHKSKPNATAFQIHY